MNTVLTRRQQEIYDFLYEHYDEFEYPPTLDELCTAMGMSSRGSMHRHIIALTEAGLLEPAVGRRGIRMSAYGRGEEEGADNEVPFLGYIAAGQPIEAIKNQEYVDVPKLLRGDGRNYVLQVQGDSMIDEGILDGDLVVIEERDQARNGEIVVALIDGCEATLKRIQQRRGQVVLRPANSAMEPMIYDVDQVEIQGVLVGQMRVY